MKPFNLSDALAGAKVITRDGRPVTIASHGTFGEYRVHGYVNDKRESWTDTGIYNTGCRDKQCRWKCYDFDLFMAD